MTSQRKNAGVTFLKATKAIVTAENPNAKYITSKTVLDSSLCVRARRISGNSVEQKEFSLYRIDIKGPAANECEVDDLLSALLKGFNLSSQQPVVQGFIPIVDVDDNLEGDHIRITPNGGRIYQEITGDPDYFHLQMTLRVYHD